MTERDEQITQYKVDQIVRASMIRPGAVHHRYLSNEVEVVVYPLLFGRYQAVIGPCGDKDDGGHNGGPEFDTFEEARAYADGLRSADGWII